MCELILQVVRVGTDIDVAESALHSHRNLCRSHE